MLKGLSEEDVRHYLLKNGFQNFPVECINGEGLKQFRLAVSSLCTRRLLYVFDDEFHDAFGQRYAFDENIRYFPNLALLDNVSHFEFGDEQVSPSDPCSSVLSYETVRYFTLTDEEQVVFLIEGGRKNVRRYITHKNVFYYSNQGDALFENVVS